MIYKYRALAEGKLIYDGDYWFPLGKSIWHKGQYPCPANCYKVLVTNHGIQWTEKITDDDYIEVYKDGKFKDHYYKNWEIEKLFSALVMPFANFTDCNGKEFYRFDIGQHRLGIICLLNIFKSKQCICWDYLSGYHDGNIIIPDNELFNSDCWTNLGNIFKNPELLPENFSLEATLAAE
jgi:hypothetical protein